MDSKIIDTDKVALDFFNAYGMYNFQSLQRSMAALANLLEEQGEIKFSLKDFQCYGRFSGHALCRELKIESFKELSRFTEDEVLAVNGIGPMVFKEIKAKMSLMGLRFSTHPRANKNSNRERNYKFICSLMETRNVLKSSKGLITPANGRAVYIDLWVAYLTFTHNLDDRQKMHLGFGREWIKGELADLAKPYELSGRNMTVEQAANLKAFAKEYYLQ